MMFEQETATSSIWSGVFFGGGGGGGGGVINNGDFYGGLRKLRHNTDVVLGANLINYTIGFQSKA